MILATDLDRTLLPNGMGSQKDTLEYFFDEIKKRKFTLIYVTGRNLSLFEIAKKKFSIENPDYLIGDVGTKIYKKENEEMKEDLSWKEYIKKNTPNWDMVAMKKCIGLPEELSLQEDEKQNEFKLSYYLNDVSKKDKILSHIKNTCLITDLNIDLIYSIDPIKDVGLIDILPKIATKVTALEFLRASLKLDKDKVIYAGDSGNDILPLTNGYKSILVKNAREEIKEEVSHIAKEKGIAENLYIASGTDKWSGDYSSGILEGLEYFDTLKK